MPRLFQRPWASILLAQSKTLISVSNIYSCPHFRIHAIILHRSSSLFHSPIPISPSSFFHPISSLPFPHSHSFMPIPNSTFPFQFPYHRFHCPIPVPPHPFQFSFSSCRFHSPISSSPLPHPHSNSTILIPTSSFPHPHSLIPIPQ